MLAVVNEDIVTAVTSGLGVPGPVIPTELAGLPLDRLRYVDGVVRDAATITAWHVGDDGVKHAVAGDGRQPVTCAWNAALVRDGMGWRVQTAGEVMAPRVKAECGRRIVAVASANTQANLTAERAAGRLSSEDQVVYAAGLDWIAAMRAQCAALIAAADSDFMLDAKWPVVPAAVVALCERF